MPKDNVITEQIGLIDLNMDWDSVFAQDVDEGKENSIPDALIKCLNARGKVDIEYIEEITGCAKKDIISALRGSIFQNPDKWGECYYKGWETADEYLSGNLIRKWEAAQEANNKYNNIFKANTDAIIKVMPPSVTYEDIYVTLGSPWVPTDIIDDFIKFMFPIRNSVINAVYKHRRDRAEQMFADMMGVRHNKLTSSWEIPHKSYYLQNYANRHRFGTSKINGINILEKSLNMKEAIIYKEVDADTKSGKKNVVDETETLIALEKQKALIREFREWVWKDSVRRARLEEIYESRFSCIKRRVFNGAFLELPDLSDKIGLYPYQKNAVARIIFTPNTLLAHDVGSGKTLVMIVAGHELKRIGLSKKNLFVVPNNIVSQWQTMYADMYPGARVLVVEPGNFSAGKRQIMLERIRDEEYDGIIMAASCFDLIKVSKAMQISFLEKRKKELTDSQPRGNRQIGAVNRQVAAITKKIENLKEKPDEDGIFFEDLGVTRLFVDEAHYYKNVPISTKLECVPGININGSEKCASMLAKTRVVHAQNDGAGIIMATGTPIANSITDVFTFQQYLQYGELSLLGLQTFDSWLGMFAEQKTEFEIDVDTTQYRMATRFSKFHNLPELTSLFGEIADFHNIDKTVGIPDCDGYEDIVIARSTEFDNFLGTISVRAEEVRKGVVPRTQDNMLKITVDGRRGALDLRLVSDVTEPYNKSEACAVRVADIYHSTRGKRLTQLIFCDQSVSQSKFNVYDDLRARLIGRGVDPDEIAYIHSARTDKEREKLFEKVRKGVIRILIGSTFKLGLGVNIQDRLFALHHLDVPWRPADMVQREGRMLRQGNMNDTVHIFRYVKEGSFDAYSWQLLETKQRFICELLSGLLTARSGSDIEDTVLDYAEVKAIAVGNQDIKERVEMSNELSRLVTLRRKFTENRLLIEADQVKIPININKLKAILDDVSADREFVAKSERNINPELRKAIREKIDAAVAVSFMRSQPRDIMTYRGFRLVIPAYMEYDKPCLMIIRKGTYRIELNDGNNVGNLIRIDNAIDGLDKRIAEVQSEIKDLERKYSDNIIALQKKDEYSDEIAELEKRLKAMDKSLGVKK